MSTNHTSNYNLSQWVKTDKVLMEDFNADNLAIDTALKNLNTSLSSKASSSELNSLQSTVNSLQTGKADASTVTEMQSKLSSLQTTVEKKQDAAGAVKLYLGRYTGNGQSGESAPKTLDFSATLGRLPALLIVRGVDGGGDGLVLLRDMESTTMHVSGNTGTNLEVKAAWNASAKTVSWYANSARTQFNTANTQYLYFAVG